MLRNSLVEIKPSRTATSRGDKENAQSYRKTHTTCRASAAALQVTLSYRQNGNTIYNKHFEEFSEAAQVKYL